MLLNHNSNRLKIIDFGLSRYLCEGEECRELLGTPEFVGKHPSSFVLIFPFHGLETNLVSNVCKVSLCWMFIDFFSRVSRLLLWKSAIDDCQFENKVRRSHDDSDYYYFFYFKPHIYARTMYVGCSVCAQLRSYPFDCEWKTDTNTRHVLRGVHMVRSVFRKSSATSSASRV